VQVLTLAPDRQSPVLCGRTIQTRSGPTDPTERENKKRVINEHIVVSGSRLADNEVEFLYQFVVQYARFRGLEEQTKKNTTGWSSDGRYSRTEVTDYFFDLGSVAILVQSNYRDDDGQSGAARHDVPMKARPVIDWFREHHRLRMLDNVRDLVSFIV
jgi:hypothetical protein